VWTRTLYGARISLLIGFSAMMTAVLIGTTIGLLSGFFGGWVDAVLMRITEIVMALPTVLLAIALRVVLPDYSPTLPVVGALDPNLYKILVAIGLVTWTGIARAVRGQVFSLKEREFIEAARAVGCSNWRILTSCSKRGCRFWASVSIRAFPVGAP
jgi:ABC-type dipeptide/oligopeptide/nickel transport system permease subunit